MRWMRLLLWQAAVVMASSIKDSNRISALGWVWEGQGLNAPLSPSIYGVGEGAKYFGLRKVIYMYHPNNEAAMQKLRGLEEVVCDITKWEFRACAYNCAQLHYDEADVPGTGLRRPVLEAKNIGTLSLAHPNITGAFLDDTLSSYAEGARTISPDCYASIFAELKKVNSHLKLWARVDSGQLSKDAWTDFKPYMDIISLWVQDSKNLTNLELYVDRCREIFRGKPLILGCYLWDFPTQSPVPLNLLKSQCERMLKHIQSKEIGGYAILGTCLIDSANEQARWLRDFIAAN